MSDRLLGWFRFHGISIEAILGTVVVLVVAEILILMLNRLLRRLLVQIQPRLRFAPAAVRPFTRTLGSLVWLAAGLLILDIWGVSVTGLWTILVSFATVVGVGFLAVWTIVSNITASFFLTIWHPFRLGQIVELLPENLKGRVSDRNLMFTVLQEADGTTLQIPNNQFFQKIFRVGERGAAEALPVAEPARKPATADTRRAQLQDEPAG
jgi:small-conductance mechanosensitive channel